MDLSSYAPAYYRAALIGLRFLEHALPTGRRFGVDADLRWKAFAGHLTAADRLELLIRDADAQWPGSMGARRVLGLEGVAEDDAFGPEWVGLEPVSAEELWRTQTKTPAETELAAALRAMAAALDVTVAPFDLAPLGPVDPSSRLVVVGPSAIVAVAEAMHGRPELDWADQVVCIASGPATRQIAAFASAALDVRRMAVILRAGEPHPEGRTGFRRVASPDATPEDAAWAAQVAGG